MKILRAVLLVVLVAPALVVVGASSAIACSCIPQRPDKVAVEDAEAVFTGTVTEVEPGVDIGFDKVTWTFAVEEVYKGNVGPIQDIRTHTQSAACGLTFTESKRYVVFAYSGDRSLTSDQKQLVTNLCMNTRPLAEGKDLKLETIATFEKMDGMDPRGAAVEPDESGGWDPLAVGAVGLVAVGAIVAVALVIARRR